MSTWLGAASIPLRSAAGVFSAADNRLKQIDTLVGEIQMDFRSLHKPNGVVHGEEIEDDDYVVDAEHLEIMTLAEQIRSDVRHLQTALDRKLIYDSSYGDEDRSMEENQEQARWFPSASQLELVVHSLDAQLKHCLLCLAMFPADELIKKKMLIHYWIGEGIVQSVAAGKDCFTDLLCRGLLQPACQREHCSKVHYCKIHPMVNWLATFLSKWHIAWASISLTVKADLAVLTKLRKLSISTGRRALVLQGDELNKLQGCTSLESLTITWGAAAAQEPLRQPISGVEGSIKGASTGSELLLPPRLEKLDLRRTPTWNLLHLLHPRKAENLKKLYIRGGKLRTFGDLEGWNVETLRVRFLKNLECDWQQFRASFGKLRFLEMRECPNLTSWECNGEGVWRTEDDDNGTTHVSCLNR